jgi:GNAT superfamily N-acetyltransferase
MRDQVNAAHTQRAAIREATAEDCDAVAELALGLYEEIGHDLPEPTARGVARTLVTSEDRHYALLAFLPGATEAIGLLTLVESCATYAGGYFAIMQEFYVRPEFRSHGIGRELLASARRLAEERRWKRLEVTAPFGERFARSVQFYRANGFDDSGPRLFLALK